MKPNRRRFNTKRSPFNQLPGLVKAAIYALSITVLAWVAINCAGFLAIGAAMVEGIRRSL